MDELEQRLEALMAVPDWMVPGAPRYWKREPMACGTGLLSALPDSVRVPRFIAETNTSDTETWRWINFQRPSLWSNMVRRRIISV